MAALGSVVQATNVELVAVIESAREKRDEINTQIEQTEIEQRSIKKEIDMLQANYSKVCEELRKLVSKRDKLNDLIETTENSYKTIVEEAKELLASVKESTNHTEFQLQERKQLREKQKRKLKEIKL